MIDLGFPPALLMILGAVLVPFLPAAGRRTLAIGLPVITLVLVWLLPDGTSLRFDFIGLELAPVTSDPLARLFATIFALMAAIGAVFAWSQASRLEAAAALGYAGGAIGVTLAGDLITLFVFWELMALGSTMVIWCGGAAARAAGLRYLAIHLFGGVLLMAGIAGVIAGGGQVAFGAMQADSLAHWLILIGFLINAGAPPLSAWLPDAYPEASWSGTVFLSAFTTKTAVFVLMRGFPGEEVLIWVGLYMVVYGLVYAFLETDLRRILAYAIVNQVGVMVVGIGIGTELALNGVAAMSFAHILYKGLLLMTAGAVLYRTGKRDITELGGLGKTMPVTALFAGIGAITALGLPLTAGFVTKTMVTLAAEESHLALVWVLLEISAAGIVLHAGLKYPWFVFFDRDRGLRAKEAPPSMLLGMGLLAGLCLAIGIYPETLYALLPNVVNYEPYGWGKLLVVLQIIAFSALAFFLLLDLVRQRRSMTIDWDWFYRRLGVELGNEFRTRSMEAIQDAQADLMVRLENLFQRIYRHHGPQGFLARTQSSGYMVMWAVVLLTAFLLLGYLGLVD